MRQVVLRTDTFGKDTSESHRKVGCCNLGKAAVKSRGHERAWEARSQAMFVVTLFPSVPLLHFPGEPTTSFLRE